MKCVVCKQAETRPGVTTVTFERGDSTFVVREVPAQVCPNCGRTTPRLSIATDGATPVRSPGW